MKFKKLLEKHGEPDALFFSFEKNKYYSVWGFEDIFSISQDSLESEKTLDDFQNKINSWKKDSSDISAVGFFSYDSKNVFYPHLTFNKVKTSEPRIWFGKPGIIKTVTKDDINAVSDSSVSLKKTMGLKGKEHYHKKINVIKDYLRSGDVYQINYTQPIKYEFDQGSSFELYLKLFQLAKPEFGCYLNINSNQIISMSPENFFTKINDNISSSPIKGTRKRSNDLVKDRKLFKELMNSEKDRAEHIMIVDLIRNDLGKICKFNSIDVEKLFNVQSYATIHHMVTKVYGQLRPQIKEKDIFRALFPGGSITGAPKQRAIEIIDQIENYSRGIYTGALGIISNTGNMIFNIAIRTLTLKGQSIVYPTGGGIVWDSESDDERMEAIQKSKILSI